MIARLAGTSDLVRLGLRRDRMMVPVWVYALTALAISTGYGYGRLYDTPAARHDFAAAVQDNRSTLAFYGHVYNPDSIGGLTAWRLAGIGAALAAVVSVLLVVRHTRADEEAGRLELVSAGVVGRYAPLTAALLVTVTSNSALALLVLAGLVVVGLPATGAAAFALAWIGAAMVFAAIAAVAAQVGETSRAANGIALGALGLAYLLRAVGDAGASWVSWLSPIGWAQQVRPFAGQRWWVLVLPAAGAALTAGVAYALAGRRDLAR